MTVECITLRDPDAGTTAQILTGFGFNCFSFTMPHGNRTLELLWAAEQFRAGTERASRSGIPILFPFPGRIEGTVFHWQGSSYQLAAGDARGNAIHGLVLDRPWRTIERHPHQATGEFRASRDGADRLSQWPADFQITVTYTLHGRTLHCKIRVMNPDNKPLPCGLGLHPYFRLPLGGRRADDCVVQLPVREQWELVDMLPTGRRLAVEQADQFQQGFPFGELQLDHVFSGLQFVDESCAASIADPHSGLRLVVRSNASFRECVVFTPPHREAICIEPYTCVPGAAALGQQGTDAGWRVLEPGASFTSECEIRVESVNDPV